MRPNQLFFIRWVSKIIVAFRILQRDDIFSFVISASHTYTHTRHHTHTHITHVTQPIPRISLSMYRFLTINSALLVTGLQLAKKVVLSDCMPKYLEVLSTQKAHLAPSILIFHFVAQVLVCIY